MRVSCALLRSRLIGGLRAEQSLRYGKWQGPLRAAAVACVHPVVLISGDAAARPAPRVAGRNV